MVSILTSQPTDNVHPTPTAGNVPARILSAEPFRRLEEKDFISVKPEQITRLVHETGALDRARSLTREFADRAKASLNGGGSGEYSRALQTVPDFILARDS